MSEAATMPNRHKIVLLMTLWGQVCQLKDAAENRAERLRFLAQTVGRVLDSANDLSAEELEKCIQALLRQARHRRHSQDAALRNVLAFPNRSGITTDQVWKVRQIEHYLGWANNPARLEGLLRAKFHESLPFLSHAQAWRVIEMLFAIAARNEAKRGKESGYKVPPAELKAARMLLKERLQYWRPPVHSQLQPAPAAV